MLYAILAYHVEDEMLSWTPEKDTAVVTKVLEVQARLRAGGRLGPAALSAVVQYSRHVRAPPKGAACADG